MKSPFDAPNLERWPCPTCNGDGFTVGPVCCGNTRNGECWCGSPVPEQRPCESCGCSGWIEVEA